MKLHGAAWKNNQGLKLVLRTTREDFDNNEDGAIVGVQSLMFDMRDLWQLGRKRGLLGTISYGFLAPTAAGRMILCRRSLGLAAKDATLKPSEQTTIAPATWLTMSRMIGRFARYPRGFVFAGIDDAEFALLVNKGSRCRQTYGDCYGVQRALDIPVDEALLAKYTGTDGQL